MRTASALITAHPGHELLLHRWLEIEKPAVFALTDGSGSRGTNRIHRSREIISKTGATCGAVFGFMPDHRWYSAILQHDLQPFREVITGISDALSASGTNTIVVDAIEHFNPMHDLAAVVGSVVARRVKAERLFAYPIEREPSAHAPFRVIELDDAEFARKLAAAHAYLELAAEVDAFAARPDQLRRERLYRFDCASQLPEALPSRPYYERFGEERISEGRYAELITYSSHIRPIALELLKA